MALDPKLLMLDEPTQGMSPSETAEIDGLIKSLAGRVTVLLIEHDIDLVMSLSDHVVVMHQGQKLFEGTPERSVRQRRRSGRPISGSTMPLLEVEALHAQYAFAPVLRGISFSVNAGEIVSIFGRNGAGKTTTLRTLMGWLQAVVGTRSRSPVRTSPDSLPTASSARASPSSRRTAASSAR